MGQEVTEKLYKRLVIEGEIIYISSIEPIRNRAGELIISKTSGEQLDKKFIILKAIDGFQYKIETIATKANRKHWMSFFSSYPIGTQMRMTVSLVGTVKTKDNGEKDIYYSFSPEKTVRLINGKEESVPAEILWMPDKEPDLNPDNSDLPF